MDILILMTADVIITGKVNVCNNYVTKDFNRKD
ncbi:hypothetical protein SP99_03701 [Enterobacter sp. BIDMC92]|nr:hypothetical protein SP99_03701 [Enterobacter sp. BIDMC92]